jgi:integrase
VLADSSPVNPAIYATIPADAAAPSTRRSLTPNAARKLYTACDGELLAPMIRLGLLIGLRPGELTGLRWGHVDLKRGVLTTRHAIQMHRGQRHRPAR